MNPSRDMIGYKQKLGEIWGILVREAGADPEGFSQFLAVATEPNRLKRCLEYRFIGLLGFGGKVWLHNGPFPYVNCYREDENPERRRIIDKTNEALKVVNVEE